MTKSSRSKLDETIALGEAVLAAVEKYGGRLASRGLGGEFPDGLREAVDAARALAAGEQVLLRHQVGWTASFAETLRTRCPGSVVTDERSIMWSNTFGRAYLYHYSIFAEWLEQARCCRTERGSIEDVGKSEPGRFRSISP